MREYDYLGEVNVPSLYLYKTTPVTLIPSCKGTSIAIVSHNIHKHGCRITLKYLRLFLN